MPPIMEDKEGNIRIVPITLRKLELKTSVRNYNEARFHLLAVAERIRNYAAYVLRARLPMDFDMVGKRRDNGQWFPFPAVFDGATHLPITDGGEIQRFGTFNLNCQRTISSSSMIVHCVGKSVKGGIPLTYQPSHPRSS